jgi:tRNA nucleotidyltransferase (CCA-adding enzyme)
LSSPEAVLERVRPRIVPTQQEHTRLLRICEALKQEIEQVLSRSGIDGTVALQGSFARDTWVKNGTDLDIFIQISPTIERGDWVERVLPTIRKSLGRYEIIERYAEHPFLEFHVEGTRVNVVPCYKVEQGDWKSATDRTPYHTDFMNKNLTDELRLEARFLKKFAKGIGVYGAEIKIGGFSGMLVDTLTLYYGSFLNTIRQASSWTPGIRLEIGKTPTIQDPKKREPGIDLLVVDPVDPNRNLAAAVRPDKLWTFVAAARQFLQAPTTGYFFPKASTPKTRAQFLRRIGASDRTLVAVSFKHPILVPDVLWGQLMKLEKSLVEMVTLREFEVFRSTIWSDEKGESAILLEVRETELSSARLQKGPPIAKREDSQSFLERHTDSSDTVRGPWIGNDRWLVEKKRRDRTLPELIDSSVNVESYGLAIPKQVGRSFKRSVKVLEGKTILSLLARPGFDKVLWEFLEARPAWLKPFPK